MRMKKKKTLNNLSDPETFEKQSIYYANFTDFKLTFI